MSLSLFVGMDILNALKNTTDEEILSNWKEIQKILGGVQHRKDLAETISILRKQHKNNPLIDTIVDVSDMIDNDGLSVGRGEFKVMCMRTITLKESIKLQLWFDCWGDNSGGWNDPQVNIYGHNINIYIPESIDRDAAVEILEQIFDSTHEDVAEYYYSKVYDEYTDSE